MFNKKFLLSLGAAVLVAGSVSAKELTREELHEQFLKKMDTVLPGKTDRKTLDFKVDGKSSPNSEYWVMTKKQFDTLKELMEYAVSGYNVVKDDIDPEKRHIVFTGKVDFKRNDHYCGIKKASLLEKLLIAAKTKKFSEFLKDKYVHVAKGDHTDVAVKADVQAKEFDVVTKKSRLYRNVPVTSQPGNLPGVYLRGDGKTTDKGNLVGFTHRADKNGVAKDYFFGKMSPKKDS